MLIHQLKRTTAAASLGLIIISSSISPAGADAVTFSDVPPTFWGYASITALANQGIVVGSYGKFEPGRNVTRAEFVKMLVASQHIDLGHPTQHDFTDVPSNQWYYPYVEAAYRLGLAHGKGNQLFDPQAPITRQDMIVMLVNSLHLDQVEPNILNQQPPYVDLSDVSSYASNSITIASYLGIVSGDDSKKVRPLDNASRAEAATVIEKLLTIDKTRLLQLTTPIPPSSMKLAVPTSPTVSKPVTFGVTVIGAAGDAASDPGTRAVALQITLPDGSVQTVSGTTTNGVGTISFTPSNIGNYSVSISSPGLQASKAVTISVNPGKASVIALVGSLPQSVTAGQPFTIPYQITDDSGHLISTDANRSIKMTITQPDGSAASQSQSDQGGTGSFSLTPTVAGNYTITLSASNLSSATATTQIVAAAPAKLAINAKGSSIAAMGNTRTLQLTVQDAYGNPTKPTEPMTISIVQSNPTTGALAIQSTSATDAQQTIASFSAVQAGTTTITASTTVNGIAAGQLTIRSIASPTDVVAGKGVWLMWRDWHGADVPSMLDKFAAAGVSHLYIEVATTSDGFYGQDALNDLLPAAHSRGIAVIGWVYSNFADPIADAARDLSVANATTPSGDIIDGLASDIEENVSQSTVTTYGSTVKAGMRSNMPLIGVTYPATWRTSYPWTTFAKYFDVMAPMEYWHYLQDHTYTADEVRKTIATDADQMRSSTAIPTLPVSIIGQGYDMFTDSGTGPTSPSASEITASMQGAKDGGAIGYSIYRLGTMTDAEWQAFKLFNW